MRKLRLIKPWRLHAQRQVAYYGCLAGQDEGDKNIYRKGPAKNASHDGDADSLLHRPPGGCPASRVGFNYELQPRIWG